jgi:hypothetical protein
MRVQLRVRDLWHLLFPRGETRLASVMGLAVGLASLAGARDVPFYVITLVLPHPIVLAIGQTWFAILQMGVVAVVVGALALAGFLAAGGQRAVFGYMAMLVIVALFRNVVRSWLTPGTRIETSLFAVAIQPKDALQPTSTSGLVALAVMVVLALLATLGRRGPAAGDPSSGDHRSSVRWLARSRAALAFGMDNGHESMPRRLVLWALALRVIAVVLGLVFVSGFSTQPDRWYEVALLVGLTVFAFAAVRWRGAPATLWIPGVVAYLTYALLGSGLTNTLALREPWLLEGAHRAFQSAAFQSTLALAAVLALAVGAAALGARTRPQPTEPSPHPLAPSSTWPNAPGTSR